MRAKPQSEIVLCHALNKNDGKKGLLSEPTKCTGKKPLLCIFEWNKCLKERGWAN